MNDIAYRADRALEIGKAAEMLVCADLILKGYRAFLTDQGLPYDVVFDFGHKLYRVQVKSSLAPRPIPGRPGSGQSYMFHIRRTGKFGRRSIDSDAFDLLALVAIDIRTIAYLPISDKILQVINLRKPDNTSKHANRSRGNIDEFSIERAILGLKI